MSKKSFPHGLKCGITPREAYLLAAEAGVSHHTVYAALEGKAHPGSERRVRDAGKRLGIKLPAAVKAA